MDFGELIELVSNLEEFPKVSELQLFFDDCVLKELPKESELQLFFDDCVDVKLIPFFF